MFTFQGSLGPFFKQAQASQGQETPLPDRVADLATKPLLQAIGERALSISIETCPEEALGTAKRAVIDTLGVTLAGAAHEATETLLAALGRGFAPGPALIFGSRRRVDILSAALVNGTAAHALDFDDCSNTMGGHPSAPIVPALWALAEEKGASGGAFLAAYIAGFQVETGLGRAVNFHHYEKGWHPTATLGVFGSAAACAHLLGLDAKRFAAALALAASMASGLKANFGTMTKPLHVGHAARNGLAAALMAEAGMSANADALDDPQGFFAVFNGAGTFFPDRVLGDGDSPLDIVEPGVAFKRHPCCASTHPAIDALLALREEHGFSPDDVARIDSWTHPRRLRHTNRPDPKSGLDGKFSVQYALARALMNGMVSVDDFTDAAVRDPAARELMSRIHAAPHPDAVMESTEHFFAEVRVTLRSGDMVKAYVDRPLGRDKAHPLPEGTLEAKFADCAGPVIGAARTTELAGRLLEMEREPSIAALSALLERQPQPLAGRARVA